MWINSACLECHLTVIILLSCISVFEFVNYHFWSSLRLYLVLQRIHTWIIISVSSVTCVTARTQSLLLESKWAMVYTLQQLSELKYENRHSHPLKTRSWGYVYVSAQHKKLTQKFPNHNQYILHKISALLQNLNCSKEASWNDGLNPDIGYIRTCTWNFPKKGHTRQPCKCVLIDDFHLIQVKILQLQVATCMTCIEIRTPPDATFFPLHFVITHLERHRYHTPWFKCAVCIS